MRVGVTGAGGFVGRALVRALLEAGHDVTALDRRAPAPAFRKDVRFIAADIRDARALADFASGTDAVVHLAAYVHRAADTGAARVECFAVNEGATCALIVAMAAGGRRQHLVFVSTIAVYGSAFEDAHEDLPPLPETAYAESKLAAENAVLEASRRGEVSACVLRPAVVYGARSPGNLTRLLALVRRGWVPLIHGGGNRKSMVHLDDLVRVLVRAVESGAQVDRRIYNVSGPALSVREVVDAMARGLGRRVRWLPIPPPIVATASRASSALSKLTGGAFPDLGRSLEVFTDPATVNAGAVARDLLVQFRPPQEGLADMAKEAPPD